MSRVDDLHDLAVLQALSGAEDLISLGIQIVDNYLEREHWENLREAGYRVPKKWLPVMRSQEEKDDWKRQKWLEQLEQARTNRPEQEYFGQEEDEMAQQPKKEMAFVDAKLFTKVFATNVNIKQVRSRSSGKWVTIITIGKDQDKVFLVSARNDGQGVSLMTDWKDYFHPEYVAGEKKEVKTTKV